MNATITLTDRTPRIHSGVRYCPRRSPGIARPRSGGPGGGRRGRRRRSAQRVPAAVAGRARHAAGRLPAVRRRTIHGMGPARLSLQTVGQSGNLHPAIGRVVLQARQGHSAVRQIHSRNQHHGAAAGGKHENAARRLFSGWISREQRCTPRFTWPSDSCSAIFWFP